MEKAIGQPNKLEWFTSGFLFKIVYLFLVLISFNNIALDIPYLKQGFVILSVALGGIVLLYRLFHFKRFLKMKYIWFLVAFVVSYVISLLLNLKYGFLDPLQALVWMVFQFFILFLKDPAQPEKQTKKEMRVLSWEFTIYMLICAFLSFLQLLFDYSVIDYTRQPIKLMGVVWGRLWGVFTDPNYAVVLSIASIFIGIYLVKCYRKVFVKILCGLNAAFQILYVAFSDSRTGLVCLAVSAAFYCYFRFAKMPKLHVKKVAGQIVSFVAAACIFCAMFVLPKGIKLGYNEIIKLTVESSASTPSEESPNEKPNTSDRVIGRDQDIEDDVSNRRFDLWKSGIDIVRLRPVFGVSIFNAQAFAREQIPSTYLINNDMGPFDSLHNAFLNVLLGQGIFGFTILMIFTVLCVITVIKGILGVNCETGEDHLEYAKVIALVSAIVAISVSMLFVGDVIYLNSGASFLFWNILGILLAYFTGRDSKVADLQSAS